ncbi:replication protein [uncultured Ligilactobacillus sp.]|uniref:replication protein n=1 Tax=uncultured Ligilactobacillus sp. TaxID=2837633 RepID=UPI002729E1D7|nr:replication protein [uncultured Ligilactobacillus sp.]
MVNEQRSNKWTFLMYKDSAPENYIDILDDLHVPYILSPWHDKDQDKRTKKLKKSHKHGAFYFDTLKSYRQVSNLISESLNGPEHVEAVISPKGMYDYFVHAENKDKTSYDIKEIETGCGFDLNKFLVEQNTQELINTVVDIIEENDFTEFTEIVEYARKEDSILLNLIFRHTYFFSKFLDSRRYKYGEKHEDA